MRLLWGGGSSHRAVPEGGSGEGAGVVGAEEGKEDARRREGEEVGVRGKVEWIPDGAVSEDRVGAGTEWDCVSGAVVSTRCFVG